MDTIQTCQATGGFMKRMLDLVEKPWPASRS